jgi:hypothetical protein
MDHPQAPTAPLSAQTRQPDEVTRRTRARVNNRDRKIFHARHHDHQ